MVMVVDGTRRLNAAVWYIHRPSRSCHIITLVSMYLPYQDIDATAQKNGPGVEMHAHRGHGPLVDSSRGWVRASALCRRDGSSAVLEAPGVSLGSMF